MSEEHEIHTEAAPFELGYQPETLRQIQVPDLPDDAQGLSAEALAHVPTLTELVEESPESAPVEAVEPQATEVAEVAPEADIVDDAASAAIQEDPSQADTWGEQLHVRMGRLTDDIHSLNARLDRLEEINNTKV